VNGNGEPFSGNFGPVNGRRTREPGEPREPNEPNESRTPNPEPRTPNPGSVN
jgi:hypothetical protein